MQLRFRRVVPPVRRGPGCTLSAVDCEDAPDRWVANEALEGGDLKNPSEADTAVGSDIYAGGEFLWKSAKGYDTRATDWTKLADTGAGHSITAVSVTSGLGYAAWCGPCWPGYVSETGFKRGAIARTDSGAWAPIALDGVPDRYISGFAVDPGERHARLPQPLGLRPPLDDRPRGREPGRGSRLREWAWFESGTAGGRGGEWGRRPRRRAHCRT